MASSYVGSSPRARGTLFENRIGGRGQRFIPAGAGNTPWPAATSASLAVHPRGRGEHQVCIAWTDTTGGSSPRARGTRRSRGRWRRRRRFIPAGAGNTLRDELAELRRTVHPRGRGEHVVTASAVLAATGSSPRARGTPVHHRRGARGLRFIPAGAGNTPSTCRAQPSNTVHPRGRGEHAQPHAQHRLVTGSSPRARGTRGPLELALWITRFIPAGAGNTPARFPITPPASVHPRGRGEHYWDL